VQQTPNRLEGLKLQSESLGTVMSFLYKAAAAVGAGITFSYLMMISFFPSGLTPGEVVFFIFIAFAFLFVYFVAVAYGAFASLWFIQLLIQSSRFVGFSNRQLVEQLFDSVASQPGNDADSRLGNLWRAIRLSSARARLDDWTIVPKFARGGAAVVASVLTFLAFLEAGIALHSIDFWELFGACLLAGAFAFLFLGAPLAKGSNGRGSLLARGMGVVVVPLVLLCMYAGPSALLNIVFERLGIRVANVSIEIPKTESVTVERAAELLNRPLIDCRHPQTDKILVHGVDVLWTGIGDQTYIQFVPSKRPERGLFQTQPPLRPRISTKFDTKSVRIIRAEPRLDPCFEVPADVLFDTLKSDLAAGAQGRIAELGKSISDNGTPAKILVRGHSDARRIAFRGPEQMDNQLLSEKRAAAVARALRVAIPDQRVEITAEGAGSREQKVDCPDNKLASTYEADQCHRPNRRVEVRITYSR